MHWPSWAKEIGDLLRTSWLVLGPFVGIWIGVTLTTRSQKRQWILDHKRAEYRELITAISDAGSKLVVFLGTSLLALTSEDQQALGELARQSANAIYSRLFIAKSLEKLDIQRRWIKAVSEFRKSRDPVAFGKIMDSIMEDLRASALSEFS